MGSEPHKPIKKYIHKSKLWKKSSRGYPNDNDRIKAVSVKPKIHTNPLPTKP